MSDDKVKTAAITAFTQYMSTHKLRKTPERYAILEKVFDITTHFVVETLYSKLAMMPDFFSRALTKSMHSKI